MISLKLDWPHPDPKSAVNNNKTYLYRIVRVAGSTEYFPGQMLTRDQVSDMCVATGIFKIVVVASAKEPLR